MQQVKVQMQRERTFFRLSNAGTRDGRQKRSFCELKAPFNVSQKFKYGGGKIDEPVSLNVTITELKGVELEDMPSCIGGMIVSERLRDWIEQAAPSHAQWLPITIKATKRAAAVGKYYLANWLKVIDCIDLAKSKHQEIGGGGPGERSYFFEDIVIDSAKVPDAAMIFRLKYAETDLCIDREMAKAMHKAGFSGPQFYAADLSIADEFFL